MHSLFTPFINYGLVLMTLPEEELTELQKKCMKALSPPREVLQKILSAFKGESVILSATELLPGVAKRVNIDIFETFMTSLTKELQGMSDIDIRYFLAGAAMTMYKLDQLGVEELTSEHFSTVKNEMTMDYINAAVECVNALNKSAEEYDSMKWNPDLGEEHVFLEVKSLFRGWFLE